MSASTAGEEIAKLDLDGDRFTSAQISQFDEDKELYKRFIKVTEQVVNNKFSFVSPLPLNFHFRSHFLTRFDSLSLPHLCKELSKRG